MEVSSLLSLCEFQVFRLNGKASFFLAEPSHQHSLMVCPYISWGADYVESPQQASGRLEKSLAFPLTFVHRLCPC